MAGIFRDSLLTAILYHKNEWSESIQQAIHKSTIAHEDALLGSTPPEDHRFQWIKARPLVKLKHECAEAVWKLNPKNPVEVAQAVWEVMILGNQDLHSKD